MRKMRIGLRAKLVIALVLSASGTTLLTGWIAIEHSYKALKMQKQQDELSIARNVAVQIDGVLRRARQTVKTLAGQPDIVGMDPARQRAAMTIVADVSVLIDNVVITNRGGRVVRMDETQPDARRMLPSSPVDEFVRPALSSRAPESTVYKSLTGQVIIAVSAPILKAGRILGVISGGILTTNNSLGYVEDIRIGKSGYAYIVDDRGYVIVHPRHELLFENFSANPAVASVLKGQEGVAEFTGADGVPILAAYAPLREKRWGVVVCQTTAESYVHAERLYYFLLLVFLGSLAVAIVIGVILAWQISKPINTLAFGARAVAEGRLDTRIAVTSRDELGDLAGVFNDMASRLKQTLMSEKLAVVGQLAAGLAHEIQNPLNVISGFADYLRGNTPEDDPRRAALDDIGRESRRCQRLVTQLLDLARPKEMFRASADINALVSDVAALVQPQARTQGVEARLEQGGGLPEVEIDHDQIKQVLLNLCLNACQAMPQGGLLRIGTASRDGSIEVTVSDSGPGISPADLPRLFTPFFTTKNAGTGLGLATSYAIVESHGGTIKVDSRPGEGASFIVSLPVGGGSHGKRN